MLSVKNNYYVKKYYNLLYIMCKNNLDLLFYL